MLMWHLLQFNIRVVSAVSLNRSKKKKNGNQLQSNLHFNRLDECEAIKNAYMIQYITNEEREIDLDL